MQRLVVLTGTLQINVTFGEYANYEPVIKNALSNSGFNVASVRLSKGFVFSNGLNVTIECYVDTQYTAEQARVNAEAVISNIPNVDYSFNFSQYLFSQVSLKILSDNQAQTTVHDSTLDDTLSKLKNLGETLAKDAVKGTASNIGTPIAIGAIVIVALILFKK